MKTARYMLVLAVILSLSVLSASCSKKEEQQPGTQQETGGQETISYIDEDVSFGFYFDEAGTQRTLKLAPGQSEFDIYLILTCPEYMEVAAVEWRMMVPEGVEMVNDRYRPDRVMAMGPMHRGHSERFTPCVTGPRILIHTFTFAVKTDLKNAVFAVMPSLDSDNLGIAECKEGYPIIRGTAYKAVVNPTD